MPFPPRPPDAARRDTANPEGEPLSGAHGRAVVVEVGRRLDGEPPGYELRRFQRGQARGLTKIVLSSSALAASPAKGLPSPRACRSLTWKPAARASPAGKRSPP